MPFESEAQRRYFYAKLPNLAKEFENATPKGKHLPEYVKKAYGGVIKSALQEYLSKYKKES